MEHRVPHKMPHTMLLHGLGQNSDSWKQVIDCLPTEQKEELHTPDLFTLTEEISYEGLYRGWEQSCQKLPGRLHLCGLSLGSGAGAGLHHPTPTAGGIAGADCRAIPFTQIPAVRCRAFCFP